jgi:hypothetical protein
MLAQRMLIDRSGDARQVTGLFFGVTTRILAQVRETASAAIFVFATAFREDIAAPALSRSLSIAWDGWPWRTRAAILGIASILHRLYGTPSSARVFGCYSHFWYTVTTTAAQRT